MNIIKENIKVYIENLMDFIIKNKDNIKQTCSHCGAECHPNVILRTCESCMSKYKI